MPINIDRFEEDDGTTLTIREGTNKWEVLMFLLRNSDKAFTRHEIQDNVNIPENSLGPVLTRLKELGVIRHKSGYWAIGKDDRLAAVAAKATPSESLDERLGPEDREEWVHTEDS